MRFALFSPLALILVACGSASSNSSSAVPLAAPSPDPCVGDAAWVVAIVGEVPNKSDYISVEHGARDPNLAPLIARGEGRDVDGNSRWLHHVSWSSQEIYEYPGRRTQKVIVARNVTGKDPRTLGDMGEPPALGAPRQLASGVVEWPAAHAASFDEGQSLFTFPDNTWVIVEKWMTPRFEAVFAASAQSPPPALTPNDTYIEYCVPRLTRADVDATKTSGIAFRDAEKMVVRFRAGQLQYFEQSYTFATPERAQQAEAEQRARCAQSPGSCKMHDSRVDGRVVHYR